jgi:hypothetical protein
LEIEKYQLELTKSHRFMKPKIRICSVVLFAAITISSFGQGIVIDAESCIKIETGSVMDIAAGDLTISSASSGDASLIDLEKEQMPYPEFEQEN